MLKDYWALRKNLCRSPDLSWFEKHKYKYAIKILKHNLI